VNPRHHKIRSFRQGFALHVVLKSYHQVFWGKRAKETTDFVLSRYGRYFGVKVYHRAIVGHHLHLILLPRSKGDLAGFLREVSGQISLRLWKAETAFWSSRPWSRVLQWGKDYGIATKYVALNYLEGMKLITRRKKAQSELKIYERSIKAVLERGLTHFPEFI
jgi:REP element-mobilizing transposase RayT